MKKILTNNSRTKRVYLNSSIILGTQILQVILGFVVRRLFIHHLGVEYLGYNSVFLNLLQMLNLADLGIGVTINSFLYRPLAENDQTRVSSLMYLYKRIYQIIGLVVLVSGIIISLFLQNIITDAVHDIAYLRILFYINLAGTLSTYFLAYKRTLIIADQKSYITSMIDFWGFTIGSIIQIIVLIFYSNYVVYSIVTVGRNIIANIVVSSYSNRKYGEFSEKKDDNIIKEYKPQIISYVKDVFVSRLGAYVFYGTDNVIISVFLGSIKAGFLSNYTLITTQVNSLVTQVLSSTQATFGNYIVTNQGSTRNQINMTDYYLCVNYGIGNFCMLCLLFLSQPFITLVFGREYLLSTTTVIWMSINLMLTVMLQLPSQLFTVYKLFKYDKPIIVISALMNIIISILLVNPLGVDGVLIGTFITSLIYLFSRFYIVCKKIFNIAPKYYVKRIFLYGLISILCATILYFASSFYAHNGIVGFIIRTLFVGLISLFLTATMLSFTSNYSEIINKYIPERLKFICRRRNVMLMSIVLLLIFAVIGGGISEVGYTPDISNKALSRKDHYTNESIGYNKKYFHLSVDDCILFFEDIYNNENNYDSIFDNPFLNQLKRLHDETGCVVSCYCFYEKKSFNLSYLSAKYINQFQDNASWLRFGFHSINNHTTYDERDVSPDYILTVNELQRIVGNESIDNCIRLEGFKGNERNTTNLRFMNNEPIIALLTSDDLRQSYGLDDNLNSYIYQHDYIYDEIHDIVYYSSDLRVEFIDDILEKEKELSTDSWNNQTGILEVFSHEWCIDEIELNKIKHLVEYADNNGYSFVFLEDITNDLR